MPLSEYKQKRNFKITTEPKGKVVRTKNLFKRFSVQEHHARNLHYDLRLEHNGVLISFAIPKKISNNPKIKRLAINVEDHPLDYINFEGVIPEGQYGAGTVTLWDMGNYMCIGSFASGYKKGSLKLVFNGQKLKGGFALVKINDNQWLFFKEEDSFCETKAVVEKVKNPFEKVDAQLALLTQDIPKGNDYIFETKFDGYRIFAFIENNSVKLLTRNNNDYTKKFSSIEKALLKQFDNLTAVLDGEVIVANKSGVSNFGALQESIKQGKNNFIFCIFDILALNGEDLRQQPLLIRKNLLKKYLKNSPKNLVFSDFVVGNGKKVFNLAKKMGLEGVIAKKIDSVYSGSRNGDWLKIKCYFRQEFIIVAYTTTEKNQDISAILLAYYKNSELIYAGKVGTGFTNQQRKELSKKFKKYIINQNPFGDEIKFDKNTYFLNPYFVAEIQFIGLTRDNLIRQGSFVGLRDDKSASEVVLEYENE